MRLTISLLRWGKVSWLCAVCRSTRSSPTGSITLVSSLRENLLLHSSYLPLGVSQRTCDLHVSSTFSSAVAGDLEAHLIQRLQLRQQHIFWRRCHHHPGATLIKLLQGESHTSNLFTLFTVLLSLLLLCVVCFLYQKSKKISYLFFSCYFESCMFFIKNG